MTELAPAISSFVGILVGSGLVGAWLKGRESRISELSKDVTKLRDKTVGDLHARFERHVEADRSQAFAAKLETVIVQNNNIMLELKKLNRESAAHSSSQARTEKSLSDLWDKFDACRQAHGGKS